MSPNVLLATVLVLLASPAPQGLRAQEPPQPSVQVRVGGTVADPSGLVVAGGHVELHSGYFRSSTTTDAQGHFVFEDLPVTHGRLEISTPGFAPLTRDWQADDPEIGHLQIVLVPASLAQTLTVTATRTATRIDQTAADVSVVSQADLASSGAVVLDSALRQVPGFSLFRRSDSLTANPTSQGVSLRGVGASGPSRAAVLVDGIPINDPFGGWVYWDRVPKESIRSVEVVEGGSSDLYGSAAMGGVINVRTQSIETPHLSIETAYGNSNTLDVSASSALALGKWAIGASADAFHTDGFILVPQDLRGPVDTRAGVDDRPVDVTVARQISDRVRFFLRGNYLGEERQAGLAGQANHTTLRQLSGGVDWQSPSLGTFAFRGSGGTELFDQNFYSAAPARVSDTLTNVQRVPVQNMGFSAQWTKTAGSHQTLVAGLETAGVRGASNELRFSSGPASSAVGAGGRQRTLALFGEDIFNFRSVWVITAGVRLDRWLNYDALSTTTSLLTASRSAAVFPDRSEQALSPRLGVTRKLPGGWALTGSVYRAFRAPTLNELYRSFRLGSILTLSNATLEAERLTGTEAGATWTSPGNHLRARGVVFWSNITRPIENVTLTVTPSLITRERENLGRTRARGLGLDLSEELTRTVHLTAGYQFTNATVVSFPANSALVGLRIPEIPRHEATFQVRYSSLASARRLARLTVACQGRAESAAYDDDQNTLRLKPYFTLDALVSHPLNSAMELFVAAENLTNQRYETALTPITNLGPPLLFRAGVRLNLGHRE